MEAVDEGENIQEQEDEAEALRAIYYDGEFSGSVPSFEIFSSTHINRPIRVRIASACIQPEVTTAVFNKTVPRGG